MIDIVDSRRRSELMTGIRGRDTAPELAVRRIAHRMGLRVSLHRKVLPGCPDRVFPKYRSACDRLFNADERDDGQDGSLPLHGANVAGVTISKPCHDDGSGSAIIPRWIILREHRPHPVSEGWPHMTGSRTPTSERNTMTVLP